MIGPLLSHNEGAWYREFGSFKICGDGVLPKTFVLRGQAARDEGHEDRRDEHLRQKAGK
jgi:hypothetical protein